MLKIYFADSSPILLSGLKTSFTTESNSFQVMGSSNNLSDLLFDIQIHKPDILITGTKLLPSRDNLAQPTCIWHRMPEIQFASPNTKIYLTSERPAHPCLMEIQEVEIAGFILKQDQLATPKVFPHKIQESYHKGRKLYSKPILQLKAKIKKYDLTHHQINTFDCMWNHPEKSKVEIGKMLGVSEYTICNYVRKVCQQLNAVSRLDALKKLLIMGLINTEVAL